MLPHVALERLERGRREPVRRAQGGVRVEAAGEFAQRPQARAGRRVLVVEHREQRAVDGVGPAGVEGPQAGSRAR
jgi:hypothetical protein